MDRIAVIGAGTMGAGIAQVFALAGFTVALADNQPGKADQALAAIGHSMDRQLRKGLLDEQQRAQGLERITPIGEHAKAADGAGVVIEAVPEIFALKSALFSDLDRLCAPGCLLLSNTSSISITSLAARTNRPHLVAGMHFMNPVPVMPLVEVVIGQLTAPETTNRVADLARQTGKQPVPVRDYPGFVANRILMPMINEAILTLQEGVAGIAEIDTVMKLGMSHPMGPLQLADYIGLDVCLAILRVLHTGFGHPKYAPAPLLVNLVEAGRLGAKSGSGFYLWGEDGKAREPAPVLP
jgi:3-hydroxybutyryl-CoA dehydrogenase